MAKIVRIDDTSDHGGKMISASGRFTVNGKPVCVDGDIHECPIRGHGNTPVSSSSKTTTGGKSVVRVGDKAGCGATLVTGSGDTETV